MYIRSVIAVFLISISLVGAIPIGERNTEVYARAVVKPHAPSKHAPAPQHRVAHKGKPNPPAPHNKPKPKPKKNTPKKPSGPHKPNKPAPHNPPPKKAAPQSQVPKLILYNGHNSVESEARKANAARKTCNAALDCHCPEHPNAKRIIRSTSCINGFCSCDNPAVNLFATKYIDAVKAVGNAPITRAISQMMQGLADVTQVASIIAGAFLGPEAKLALKVALLGFPDTGPSHIDQATKGILTSVL